jgi:O-antigen ligase
MQLALLVGVIALLFLRPQEIVPGLGGMPIYEGAILLCMISAVVPLLKQVSPATLLAQPITFCVVGLLPAIVLSHAVLHDPYDGLLWGFRVFKVVVLYLLIVSIVRTLHDVQRLLRWLLILICVVAGVALAQYHGLVSIPDMEVYEQRELDTVTGESRTLQRLCGPGIFHDPNDLCVIVTVGILLGLHWLGERRLGTSRFLLLLPLSLLGYAVTLTHSRGGLIALLAGLFVHVRVRIGTWRALLLAVVAIPALVELSSGRATRLDLETQDNTFQSRLRHWSDGLVAFRDEPLFGVGAGCYVSHAGAVAHNSFLETFTELGFAGGCLFLGAFALSLRCLRSKPNAESNGIPRDLRRLRSCLLAIVVAMAVGMLSLSREYNPPTYVVLALATVCIRLSCPYGVNPHPRLRPSLVFQGVALGGLFLIVTHGLVLLMVQRS